MPKPRTSEYKDLIAALNRRIGTQEQNIDDAERRHDAKQVTAMNIRINESRTIISCIETGRLDHL